MKIQKIFSDIDGDERLYSVLMNEEEYSLYSSLGERLYAEGGFFTQIGRNLQAAKIKRGRTQFFKASNTVQQAGERALGLQTNAASRVGTMPVNLHNLDGYNSTYARDQFRAAKNTLEEASGKLIKTEKYIGYPQDHVKKMFQYKAALRENPAVFKHHHGVSESGGWISTLKPKPKVTPIRKPIPFAKDGLPTSSSLRTPRF